MNLIADRNGKPSQLTRHVSHALVGALAAAAVGPHKSTEAALVAFVVAYFAHAYFDAPVAKGLVTALA